MGRAPASLLKLIVQRARIRPSSLPHASAPQAGQERGLGRMQLAQQTLSQAGLRLGAAGLPAALLFRGDRGAGREEVGGTGGQFSDVNSPSP